MKSTEEQQLTANAYASSGWTPPAKPPRPAGKTTAMVKAAAAAIKNGDELVIVVLHRRNFAGYVGPMFVREGVNPNKHVKFVIAEDLQQGKLLGVDAPVFWDHEAVQ